MKKAYGSALLILHGLSRVPVTPGDDFYRFRKHVGQAADHFDARFVPAKINQRKATAHRLYEIAQELDPERP